VVRPGELDASPRQPAAPVPPPPPPSTIEPLTSDLVRVHLTADKRFEEKCRKAKDLLSHSRPGAGLADVLEAALDALIERHEKRRGLVERPLATPRPSADPGRVPAHVRREVWKRDGGRCQWVLASGEICGSTHRVEVDHVEPRALGGPATVERCRLLCRPHNLLAAREILGDQLMDRYTRNPRAEPSGAGG
jgi:5-methylcytosine-specific restriction endonuclease McrA